MLDEKQFSRYKEDTINALKKYREDIESNPDKVLLELTTFEKEFDIEYSAWANGEGFPSQPKGAHVFFFMTAKEIYKTISHLEETGEWRIPCALGHFDGLLSFFKEKNDEV
jgi:hypothetical protein